MHFGSVLPQTAAFVIERAMLLTGAGSGSHLVATSLSGLSPVTAVAVVRGCLMLRAALRRAGQGGGISVVVRLG